MYALRPTLLAASILFTGACSSMLGSRSEPTPLPVPDPVAETRAGLQGFGASYGYDVGYLEQLLALSPAAYDTFAAAMAMADHRVHLSLDEHYVAVISALLADDCGACTQLNLKMAAEAGVNRSILRLLLETPESLPTDLLLIHEYTTTVVKGENTAPELVAALRQTYGDAGFAELAVNVLGARIYPGLRRALGAEKACPPPTLDF